MNKLVLFDWGGVILDIYSDGYTYKNAWEDAFYEVTGLRKTHDELMQGLQSDNYGFQGDVLSYREFVDTIVRPILDKHYGYRTNDICAKFVFSLEEHLQKCDIIDSTIKLMKDVSKIANVGILSNCAVFAKKTINKQTKDINLNYKFLSFEIGHSKPNKEIYEHVIEASKFKPSDILLIDDSKANCEKASELGWNTFNYNPDKDVKDLREFINSFIYQ